MLTEPTVVGKIVGKVFRFNMEQDLAFCVMKVLAEMAFVRSMI